ncbi:MAG: Unknown protein [uncultured Sulfurovum sp.]|uniref:Uncharacterized protein n=1 Tax=uncultured Sulfurovum sp. TaxID=269237 RepID=A0A6S6T7Q9_9BACT|nr:MAG: Unknown protein [uncultured Sulfurovum sp.]
MGKDRKKLTLAAVTAVTQKAPLQEKKEDDLNIENIEEVPKKVKLKDLEKFSKSVRFPLVWKEEIESNIDYPTDLSSFIVEAIKEKMEREEMKIFIG